MAQDGDVAFRLLLARRTGIRRLGAAGAVLMLAVILSRLALPSAGGLIAGAALLLLTAVQPAVGLAALAVVIPFGKLIPLPGLGMNAVDLLVALAAAAWLGRAISQRRVALRPTAIFWPLAAWVWLGALSLTQAVSWREGLPEWLKWAEFALLYLLAAQALDSRRLRWVLGGLAVAGLLEAGLGAYQFLRQVGPAGFVLLGRFMRAYGTFEQPNPYAGYLGYLAPMAASLAIGAVRAWWRTRRLRDLATGLACGGIGLALAAAIGMSWSRGAWLGLAAALAAVATVHSRRTAVLTAVALLVMAFAVMTFGTAWAPESLTERLADLGSYVAGPDPARTEINDANFAVLERLAHWQAGLAMFADHPWLGVGLGNYGVIYPGYAPPHWYEPLGHAHNYYINTLAETGVMGAAAFATFWASAFWLAARSSRRLTAMPRAFAIGVLGSLVFVSVHSLFDNVFVQHMQLQLALMLGGLASLEAEPA